MTFILGQWLDRNQRLNLLSALPVLLELVGVQPRPLAYEAQRARRKRAAQHAKCAELDLGDVLAVLGVEAHDSVEG